MRNSRTRLDWLLLGLMLVPLVPLTHSVIVSGGERLWGTISYARFGHFDANVFVSVLCGPASLVLVALWLLAALGIVRACTASLIAGGYCLACAICQPLLVLWISAEHPAELPHANSHRLQVSWIFAGPWFVPIFAACPAAWAWISGRRAQDDAAAGHFLSGCALFGLAAWRAHDWGMSLLPSPFPFARPNFFSFWGALIFADPLLGVMLLGLAIAMLLRRIRPVVFLRGLIAITLTVIAITFVRAYRAQSFITPRAMAWIDLAYESETLLPTASLLIWYWWPLARPGRGALACRTCGYNLTGNTSGRCPECGTAVPAVAMANSTAPPSPQSALD